MQSESPAESASAAVSSRNAPTKLFPMTQPQSRPPRLRSRAAKLRVESVAELSIRPRDRPSGPEASVGFREVPSKAVHRAAKETQPPPASSATRSRRCPPTKRSTQKRSECQKQY